MDSAGPRKGGHEYNWKGNILCLQEIAYEHARIDVAVRDVVPVEPRVNQIIALDFNSLLTGEFDTVIIVGVNYHLAIKRITRQHPTRRYRSGQLGLRKRHLFLGERIGPVRRHP